MLGDACWGTRAGDARTEGRLELKGVFFVSLLCEEHNQEVHSLYDGTRRQYDGWNQRGQPLHVKVGGG